MAGKRAGGSNSVSVRVTVTRPELTAEERKQKEQEIKKAVAAFFLALREKEKT